MAEPKKAKMSRYVALAEKAFKEAVRDAIAEHRRQGRHIIVERKGKVVPMPGNLVARERRARYHN